MLSRPGPSGQRPHRPPCIVHAFRKSHPQPEHLGVQRSALLHRFACGRVPPHSATSLFLFRHGHCRAADRLRRQDPKLLQTRADGLAGARALTRALLGRAELARGSMPPLGTAAVSRHSCRLSAQLPPLGAAHLPPLRLGLATCRLGLALGRAPFFAFALDVPSRAAPSILGP